MMLDPPLSRKKLVEALKAAKVDSSKVDCQNRYLYVTGRNTLADNLLVGLACGDFDEDVRK